MAINPVAPLSIGDVAQAYSVPLEGMVDNLQQQQAQNIQQQRYAQQLAMQQQQMDLQNQDAIDNALGSVHASGTAYDELIRGRQRDLYKQVVDFRKKNPKDIAGARSLARLGANELNYASQIAKDIADRTVQQVSALHKDKPFYNTNSLTADVLNRAFKDEKGNFRSLPDTNAIYQLGDLINSGNYIDQPAFDRTVRESFAKTYQPQESERRYKSGNIPMLQQVSSPFYRRLNDTGSFEIDAKPVQYGDVSIQSLNPSVKRQLMNDAYLPIAIPRIKQDLVKLDPRYATLPEEALNEAALYNYVEKYGDSVKSTLSNTREDPAYAAQYKQQQDAIQNRQTAQRLGMQRESLDLQEEKYRSKQERNADINVMKDSLTGAVRHGTTPEKMREVFDKYKAPPADIPTLSAIIGKYSMGKSLSDSFNPTQADGGLSKTLVPINISGAYTSGKVVDPFTSKEGTARLFVDKKHKDKNGSFKKFVLFQPFKKVKDGDDGPTVEVPDYDNIRIYENDNGIRFIDQLKDIDSQKGFQVTESIEEQD